MWVKKLAGRAMPKFTIRLCKREWANHLMLLPNKKHQQNLVMQLFMISIKTSITI